MNDILMRFPEQDVVLRSGVTLRRNYCDLPFTSKMDDEDVRLVEERVGEALSQQPQSYEFDHLSAMDEQQKGALAEQGLLNRLDLQHNRSSLFIDQIGCVNIALCGQEHILIRALRDGLNLRKALLTAARQEQLLSQRGEYAFDPTFGFLTSRSENAGTGICAWCVLHLPLLAAEKNARTLAEETGEQGYLLAALDEGAGTLNKRFLLSTKSGFGLSEQEQILLLEQAALRLVQEERQRREAAKNDLPTPLADALCRSQAILQSARLMSAKEMMIRLADLRLGVCLGLFDASLTHIDQLERSLRPCGLRKRTGLIEEQALNAARADALRDFMHALS